MNPILEQMLEMLSSLTADELLHLRDEIDDYLDETAANGEVGRVPPQRTPTGRVSLPRIGQLYDWGAVRAGDQLHVLGHESQQATLIGPKTVEYRGQRMSIYAWGKLISSWKGMNIYKFVVVEREGRTLGDIRHEEMLARGMEYPG